LRPCDAKSPLTNLLGELPYIQLFIPSRHARGRSKPFAGLNPRKFRAPAKRLAGLAIASQWRLKNLQPLALTRNHEP
jgi:hypothetical protein